MVLRVVQTGVYVAPSRSIQENSASGNIMAASASRGAMLQEQCDVVRHVNK